MKTAATKLLCIRRPIAVVFTTVALLTLIPCALAQPADVGVVAHGTAKRLYVGMAEGGSDPETWIQYRTDEQPVWRPFARFDGRAISLGHTGGEIVALFDNGSWELIWDHGRRRGPPLPDRRRLLALGGDGTTLYAIGRLPTDTAATAPATSPAATPATQPTHAVGLWVMEPAGWSYVCDLPLELNPDQSSQAQVIAHNGQPMIAIHQGKELLIFRLVDQAWQRIAGIELSARDAFRLIHTPDHPLLWTAGETGPGQIRIIDDAAQAPLDLAPAGDLSQPVSRAFARFSERVYLVFEHDDELAVQAYEPNGQPADDLDTLGPPHTPSDPRVSELLHLVVLAAMLFVLVTTLRQRKLEPISPDAIKQVQIAPLMTRLYAGVIDVSPFLVAMGWVISWAQSMPDPAEALVEARAQWPVLLAIAIYIVHTLIGEVIFGRSFGKWCLGLRIASIDGHPPTPTAAAMRNLLRIIDLVVIFPLPLLLILYTPLRQRIGDIAARTIVIRDLPDGAPSDEEEDETENGGER